MDIDRGTPLLGGLSPAAFMRRHWQRKPLLVRAALPGALPALTPARLFALAARDDVEARLVVRDAGERWSLRQGPLPRRSLPPLARPGWTVLVQGVDRHDAAAHELLGRFRFIADARLDDVMVSFASDRGGVGPHVDSYDVFLLQLAGRRRWRVGRTPRPRLRDDVPLRILAGFAPSQEWLLEPGDMLYLPPGWGHDGIAEGRCLTASIGFRAPAARALAASALQRLADNALADTSASADNASADASAAGRTAAARPGAHQLYRDPGLQATTTPARIPASMQSFANAAVRRLLAEPAALRRSLGELLSEPKDGTWFERCAAPLHAARTVVVGPGTRMLYDTTYVYVNGESFRCAAADAKLLRRLADRGRLAPAERGALGARGQALLADWFEAGWLGCAAAPVLGTIVDDEF